MNIYHAASKTYAFMRAPFYNTKCACRHKPTGMHGFIGGFTVFKHSVRDSVHTGAFQRGTNTGNLVGCSTTKFITKEANLNRILPPIWWLCDLR